MAEGQVVARHGRCYGQGERVLDPLHYLATLERKPAALDHAPVYRDWQLPAAFGELRRALEQRMGARTGARHFIRVLQLLPLHSLARVERAIVVCRQRGRADAAAITAAADRLARDEVPASDNALSISDNPSSMPAGPLAAVRVPAPDLTRFNRLLSPQPPGDRANDATDRPAVEGQPEAAQAADHAGRV